MSIKLNHPEKGEISLTFFEIRLADLKNKKFWTDISEGELKCLIDKIKEQDAELKDGEEQFKIQKSLGLAVIEEKNKEIESMNDALSAYIKQGDTKIAQQELIIKSTNATIKASNRGYESKIAELNAQKLSAEIEQDHLRETLAKTHEEALDRMAELQATIEKLKQQESEAYNNGWTAGFNEGLYTG